MPEQEWARSKEGMNPVEISISISMPEFDGIIHGVPVAAKHMKENGEVEYLPISERMAFMVSKAKNGRLLRSKENKDKKLQLSSIIIRPLTQASEVHSVWILLKVSACFYSV